MAGICHIQTRVRDLQFRLIRGVLERTNVGARKHGSQLRGTSYGASGRDEGRGGIEATARCSGTAAGGVGRGPAGRHRALGLKDAPRVLTGPPNNHRFGERRRSVGFPSPAGCSLADRLADSSEDGRKIVRLTTLFGPPAKSQLRGAGYSAYVRGDERRSKKPNRMRRGGGPSIANCREGARNDSGPEKQPIGRGAFRSRPPSSKPVGK